MSIRGDNCIIAYGIWLTDPDGAGGDDAVACLQLGLRLETGWWKLRSGAEFQIIDFKSSEENYSKEEKNTLLSCTYQKWVCPASKVDVLAQFWPRLCGHPGRMVCARWDL